MKSVIRWATGAAIFGVIAFLANQSPATAITILAATVIFGGLATEDRLKWHGKLLDRLNGIAEDGD